EKDFNHEQILKIAQHFSLSDAEKDYLVDMLSLNRAGTADLRALYSTRLKNKKEQNELLKNRFEENRNLSPADQAEYYSHWIYGAVHMASTIPAMQRVDALAKHFNISNKDLLAILEFLASKGLIAMESGSIRPGNAHLYVGKDSPLVNQHHTIWRVKALHDLKSSRAEDFHYSLCFSISQKDWGTIREKMLATIEDCLKVIRPSKEEKLGLICVDFQEV
ncbi:MAG: DUF4423 domain-containing protein, partial [Bdellovibrionota bacterium]